MSTLLITPMQKELDLFVQACVSSNLETVDSSVGRLPIIQLPELSLGLARGGAGKAQFAVHTQHLLDAGEWDLVICGGGAGAIADGLSVGDVVVATKTVEHDYKNRFNEKPVPSFRGSAEAIAGIRSGLPLTESFRVAFGAVASGDEDVIDAKRRKELRQATRALVVAWEGAGGARACRFSGVPYVEIRGVTDMAGPDTPSDFRNNLETAMRNLATLITSWFAHSA